MLKIGEFSKIAQVSIKTLRYYDQVGLFKPAHIDRYNGYRYYTLSQLIRLNRILTLKDLEFSLDQICDLLAVDLSPETLQKMLDHKASELRQRILDDHSRLSRVEDRIKNLQEAFEQTYCPVVLKSAPNLLVATVRQTLPMMNNLPEWQNEHLTLINQHLVDLGLQPEGPAILIYHQDEYRDTDLDVEAGTIIRETRDISEKGPPKGLIRIYTLTGVNHLATAICSKASSPLAETYASLTHWTQTNGYHPIGPWRELIYQQTEHPTSDVIEVQRPVMKAFEYYQQLEINKMEPKIITRPEFTIAGLRYFGKNEHNEIPELWNVLNRRMKEIGGLEHNTGEAAIGLCITPEDEPIEGAFEYVAGFPVNKVENIPDDFVVRHVPEQTYAVFAHKGDMPSLSKTYEYIYETWLPQSEYQLTSKMDFEYYNEDFKDFAPDSVFYIYIPIEKA